MSSTVCRIGIICLVIASACFISAQNPPEKLSAVFAAMTESQFRETQQAANAGDARALTLVAMAYQDGRFVQKNEDAAFRLLHKAADQGYPQAQNMLGSAYELGIGTYSDKQEALNWYKQAARRGYPAAQFNVGNLYERDTPMQDAKLAYAWWLIAAESGDETAQDARVRFEKEINGAMIQSAMIAGNMLLDGTDVPQNTRLGLKWLNKAAELGQSPAKRKLAIIYLEGKIAPQDTRRAIAILTELAQFQGYARLALGDIYATDKYVSPDLKLALSWWEKAAYARTPQAFSRLGNAYLKGTAGAKADIVTAAMYFMMGSDLGDDESKGQLAQMKLLDKESKQANKKAEKWARAHRVG